MQMTILGSILQCVKTSHNSGRCTNVSINFRFAASKIIDRIFLRSGVSCAVSLKQAPRADGAPAVQWPWTKVLAFFHPTDYSTPHSEKRCPRSHLAPPSLRCCLAEGSLLATFRNQWRGCLTERARRHGASARKNRCGGYGNRRN